MQARNRGGKGEPWPNKAIRNVEPIVRWSGRLAVSLLLLCLALPAATAQSFGTAWRDTSNSKPLPMQPFPHDAILLPSPFHPFLIGPYAGPEYTIHRGDFTITENGLVCCTFEHGTGTGFTAGVKSYLPFGGDNFLSPRLAFTYHSGTFETLSEPFPLFGVDDTIENVRFRDELATPLPSAAFDLMYCYRLGLDSTIGLYAIAGPGLEYIAEASFTKKEGIAILDGVTYLDGTDERELEIDYTPEAARILLSARAGLSLLYKINEHIYLNPELTASFPLNTINDNWRMYEFQGTFGLILGL